MFGSVTETVFLFSKFSFVVEQEFLLVTGNFSLRLIILLLPGTSYYVRNVHHMTMRRSLFLWKEITPFLLICTLAIISFFWDGNWFCLISAPKCGDCKKNLLWGLRILCHLGCQDARKKPTLSMAKPTNWQNYEFLFI